MRILTLTLWRRYCRDKEAAHPRAPTNRNDFLYLEGQSMKQTRIFTLIILLLLAPLAGTNAQGSSTNLLTNGDFETGTLAGWEVCGGVRLMDTQAGATPLEVHQGRYALRLGNPTDDSCPGGVLDQQLQAHYDNLAMPADATGLTLSFWYSRQGNFEGGAFWTLTATLEATDDGEFVKLTDYVYSDEAPGWNLARFELAPAEVAKARGRTFRLSFTVQFSLSAEANLAYYLDEITVVPQVVRTPIITQLPPALQSDGTRPLVGTASTANGQQIVRVERDARQPLPIYAGQNRPEQPLWSPDGKQIAVREDTLQSEAGEQPSITWAQISVVTLLDENGGAPRTLYQTIGKKLIPGSPPGCRAPRTDCLRYDDAALDNTTRDYSWSPDGSQLVVIYCTRNRYADGYTTDDLCYGETVTVATGAKQPLLNTAVEVDWGSNNRLLYRVLPNLANIQPGIYELDMNNPTGNPVLLFGHKTTTNLWQDVQPTWSPDGRFFVTWRLIAGNHYDATGVKRLNHALMFFDRQNPNIPRQVVLVDFGRTLSNPAWSPDGQYLLYNVQIGDNLYEIYWLEVATGKVGSYDAQGIFVDWRKSQAGAPTPTPTPGPTSTPNPALTQRLYLPVTKR
jgi:Tol biopolymer transport system component